VFFFFYFVVAKVQGSHHKVKRKEMRQTPQKFNLRKIFLQSPTATEASPQPDRNWGRIIRIILNIIRYPSQASLLDRTKK